MNRKSLKIIFATALCLGALASPAFAQINISIDLGIAPPPPRVEVIHEGRPGYLWIEGFWFWDGHKHRWAKGHWEKERPGHYWVPARWEDRSGRHHYEPGRWEVQRNDGPGNHGRGNAYGHDKGNNGRGHDRDDRRDDDRDDHRGGRDHDGR